jgi:cellulose synthase/poly-beta-1,6-N-acetylglucosamine synthase-like glycosyltransferase
MAFLFWFSLVILFYTYAGYPGLVMLLARIFGREPRRQNVTPAVSLLIPAYNEEAHIERKLLNSLALDYPRDRLEIVVASDGSTDRTDAIVKRFHAQGVRLLQMRENIGKSAMLTRAMPLLRGEIVVFSDVTSELEPIALRRLVRNFADRRVGCVSGSYKLITADIQHPASSIQLPADLRAHGEGLYWKYETFLKRQESRLHSILGAHGAFYAIRKSLFVRLEEASINDDYLIPMRIVSQGYRAVYEPSAVAWELELASIEGEFSRRRRIAAGNCQQIVTLRNLLSPFHGWVALCFFSHKVLRTLAPLFMVALLVSSLWLPAPLSAAALGAQAAFYLSAAAGYVCQRQGRSVRWLSPPLYFCLGNLAMLAGLLKFCFSRQPLAWERAR